MKINNYYYAPIGARIKQVRKSNKYTQEQLAEKIGMSSKNLSQLERGATGLSIPTLISICQVLDISADYILFGAKNTYQQNAISTQLAKLSEEKQLQAEEILTKIIEICK